MLTNQKLPKDQWVDIELPKKRGGQATAIVGNPPDYIIIFGGMTEEIIYGSMSKPKIK